MTSFELITIFPEIFNSYIKEGLISKACLNNKIKINIHNLRDWSEDKHKKVDDKPFGGGVGMILKPEPIFRCISEIKKVKKSKVIVFSPRGKKFNQKSAYKLSKEDQLIMVCGRYDGIDERVSDYMADEIFSIGDYVLMGGEIPAMILIESISRLIPGVIGKESFIKERFSFKNGKFKFSLEYPQYTRPAEFKVKDFLLDKKDLIIKNKKASRIIKENWKVPSDLISGDHQKIDNWRKNKEKKI
jgi:tRNA (guanine37-N1)-methyltransferase